jgi:proteasome lid subunit RPN8/RPN11
MRIHFKIALDLYKAVHEDLVRPHKFADERMGFLVCKPSMAGNGTLILAQSYLITPDDWYIPDERFGCVFNSDAMRVAMQAALSQKASIFHVHVHDHYGEPWFSRADLRESREYVPNFWHVQPEHPHGTVVFSHDEIAGLCWLPGQEAPQIIQKFSIVGGPLKIIQEATWRAF